MINITINRNRLQTFFLSNLVFVTRRRFSLLGGSRTKLDSRNTHITSQNGTYPWRHSIEISQIEIHAYLFRFLFSIPHTSVLIPPGHNFCIWVCLVSRAYGLLFFLAGCIWYFAWRGWSGQHALAEMEKRDC
jgi:hypothetical protein